MKKLFTKSRFKIALDCPTKLYYASNDKVYANASLDDPFLKALAKGGFQVGALAKCYYPEGVEVHHQDYENSVAETTELLKRENVVIFEAALRFGDLFIRVDILEKKGQILNLIEVKSKSANPAEFEDELWDSRELKKKVHSLKSVWKPYIYDVAFQTYVAKNALPCLQIQSFLMCADKSKVATVEGMNQKFLIKENGRKTEVISVGDINPKALGVEVLCRLDISSVVAIIHDNLEMSERFDGKSFEEAIKYFSEKFAANEKIQYPVGANCKGCEFRTEETGKKSGFNECWTKCHGMTTDELEKPFVFDVWNFRGADKAIAGGKHLMEELDEADFSANTADQGLSMGQRQWLQVERVKNDDASSYLDKDGLAGEFNKFTYPLHMIDFETCMVAIPFNKGRHPYEQVAFQFSHHTIQEDGTVEHADEYINCTPGEFPNFQFVRALKKALSKDNGTIFRYSNHENTVLNQIKAQLLASEESDKEALITFIDSVTSQKDGKVGRVGERTMVDLLEMVKKYYYSPNTEGSNSIKYVLPAILNESAFLKEKYTKAIYNSGNFRNHAWTQLLENGEAKDPYKSLPAVFDQYDDEKLDLMVGDEIRNGGAALTAYAMMQFTQMSDEEREKVKKALLRYCELDTLAMVMIYEFWKSILPARGARETA